MSRRLTLNLGLRYEYTGPLSEKSDRISNFLPAVGLVRVGQGLDTLYDRDWNNFAPLSVLPGTQKERAGR